MRKNKLLKKVAAIVSAVAMAVAMVPFVGGTQEVKAGSTTADYGTYTVSEDTLTKTWKFPAQSNNDNRVSIEAGDNEVIFNGISVTASEGTFSYNGQNALGVNTGNLLKIPVTAGSTGKITVKCNGSSSSRYIFNSDKSINLVMSNQGSSADYDAIESADGYINLSVDGNTYKITEIVVQTDDPSTAVTKVDVSGKISTNIEDLDLSGYTIALKSANDEYTTTSSADGSYEIKNVKGDGAEYAISIKENSSSLELQRVIESLGLTSITVGTSNITNANIQVNYSDIINIWDFGTLPETSYEGVSNVATYKGLLIDATNRDNSKKAKFAISGSRVQLKYKVSIKVPVSDCGKITITTSSKSSVYLIDGVEKTGSTTITTDYSSENGYVEITTKDAGEFYITKIVVEPNATVKPDGNITDVAPMLQYKKQDNGKYSVRVVYEVPTDAVKDKTGSLGVIYNENEYTGSEELTGYTVYSKIKANGVDVTASEGNSFVVVEITNVPATANFSVTPYAVVGGSSVISGATAMTINMANIIK